MPFSGLEPRLRLAVVLGILGIAGLSGFGLLAVSRANDAVAVAALHAQDARERLIALNGAMSALQDALAGQRGYLLTGDRRFLEPYERALPRLASNLERLRAPGGSPRYVDLHRTLETQSAELLAFLAATLDTPAAVPASETSGLSAGALGGKQRMDELRATVAAMRGEVDDKVAASWQEFEQTLAASRRTAMLSLGAAGTLALALVAMLVHYASRRRHAEEAARGASTQLRHSERAARDQAMRLKATLDHIVDGVITINESGSIESFSAGAERMLGWRAEEVLRRDVAVLMPDSYAAGHGRAIERHRRTGVNTIIGTSRELEARRRDGTILPVEISLGEVQLDDRHLYIGVLRDLTERRRVDRLQNELLSTVSHEFRTPLTSIVGALGLLKGGAAGELAPQAHRLVELAHDNGHRLVRLVNDFLDLEKMRSGKLEFRLAPHALGPLLRQSVESTRGYADGYGVALQLSLPDEDLLAFVDPERVQQVLANLVSNAVKFSPRDGTVQVALARDGGAAVISVHDDGPGIPPEFRARVFEKFAQADASDRRGRAGTGLGLSIVKSIVERLDGQVGFDSAPGRGTTFRVGLPLWHTKEAAVTRHGGGRHVLVVEDDPDVALVLGELLRSAGYDARTVGTGGDALDAVGAAPVDAVLLDLHLPDRNGRTLVREFRERFGGRRVPILILSATFGPNETHDASLLGADGCFEKPVDGPRLLDALQRLLPTPGAAT